jgi:tetratricopeptide (TPR) repeat protein
VQVWNAADGSTLLSTKYDAEVTDLFALQDRIAESLLEVLGVETETPDAAPPTDNPQAYELFLRAVDRMSHGNRWDTRTAVEMLRSVVDLDPGFAEAWARLAQACVAMGFSFEPDADWTDVAENAIERALSLDPTNVQARVGKGRLLWSPDRGFQNRAALEALGDAVRINPTSHQALLWQALVFMHVGLLPEALAGLNEALAIQPDDPFTLNFAGQVHEFLGHHEQAGKYQTLALSQDPTHQFALLFTPTALVHLGNFDAAERGIRSAKAILGEDKLLIATEAMMWARRGDGEKAEERLSVAEAESKTVAHSHHAWHHIASTHALLGRPAEAVRWLEKAATTGLPNHPLFNNDANLASLKGDAGFDALIRRLETECAAYRREFVSGRST